MKKNLLSVIIPTFHRNVSIIERAVKSVQNQSYPYIEIIIVDDNESNYPLSINIEEFCKHEDIIYIKQFGNKGASNARNIGVANSHGEFIAFLDDDDEWLPTKALEQIAILKRGYGLVFSKGLNIDTNSILNERPYGNNSRFIQVPNFEDLLIKNYIGTTSQIMVTRESFFQVNGFDSAFPARQDYDFCLRISQQYKLYGIDKILFKHYHHCEYQVSKDIDSALIGYQNLYKKYKKYYRKCSLANLNICCKIAKAYLNKKKYMYWFIWTIRTALLHPSKLKYILDKSTEKKILQQGGY